MLLNFGPHMFTQLLEFSKIFLSKRVGFFVLSFSCTAPFKFSIQDRKFSQQIDAVTISSNSQHFSLGKNAKGKCDVPKSFNIA